MDISTGLPFVVSDAVVGPIGPAPIGADDLAQDRFREVMNGPLPVDASTAGTPRPREPGADKALGDAILSGVDQLTSEFQQAWAAAQQGRYADTSTWSAGQMIQLQGRLLEASVMLDVIGKGVSKAAQDIEQLTKLS